MSCPSCACGDCRAKCAPKFIRGRTYEVVRATLNGPPVGMRFVARDVEWTGEAWRCSLPGHVTAWAKASKLVRKGRT